METDYVTLDDSSGGFRPSGNSCKPKTYSSSVGEIPKSPLRITKWKLLEWVSSSSSSTLPNLVISMEKGNLWKSILESNRTMYCSDDLRSDGEDINTISRRAATFPFAGRDRPKLTMSSPICFLALTCSFGLNDTAAVDDVCSDEAQRREREFEDFPDLQGAGSRVKFKIDFTAAESSRAETGHRTVMTNFRPARRSQPEESTFTVSASVHTQLEKTENSASSSASR